jgi:hypothetical protein
VAGVALKALHLARQGRGRLHRPVCATPTDAGAPYLGGGLNQMPRGATPATSTLQARGRQPESITWEVLTLVGKS